MLLRLLNFSRAVNPQRITIITLSVGLVLLYAYIHEQNVQLSTAQLVYKNPSRIARVAKKRETGMVHIITRYIERPSGEKETTIEETHDPVVETTVTSDETTPVAIAYALAPIRSDRYLVSVGFNKLSLGADGKALFVGYGIKNRVDIQVGGVQHDGFSPWVLATLRF